MDFSPPAPTQRPQPAVLVLGRFQPLHRGHTHLLRQAIAIRDSQYSEMTLRVMLGSSNCEQSPEDPWLWMERQEMVSNWLEDEAVENHQVLPVPDLGDEQRWVGHASAWHGDAGVMVTSHQGTRELYAKAGWKIHWVEVDDRESLQGWRVRQTLKMLCTVTDKDAVRMVMMESLEQSVIDWLLAEDERLRRLAFLGPSVEHVG